MAEIDICEGCEKECTTGGLPGCAEWRKKFAAGWNKKIHRDLRPKREHFTYEHPDLVREGITWTGEIMPDRTEADALPVEEDMDLPPECVRKQCPVCGKSFFPRRQNQKYCSEGCSKNSYYARKAEKEKNARADAVRICVVCGGEIPKSKRLGARTCSEECIKKLSVQNVREKRARRRAEKARESEGMDDEMQI